MNLRTLHAAIGVEPKPILGIDGRVRLDAFGIGGGIVVRLAARWRALLAVLFGHRGVLIAGDGERRPPVVVVDWETYSRMLVGLAPEQLADLGMGDVRELARADHGANDNGG